MKKRDFIWASLSAWFIGLSLSDALCTTVPNPSIRYTINNQTDQRIIAFVQIESDDAAFSKMDTVNVVSGFQEGLLTIQSQRSTLKPYQRLIIQTNQRYYQTPTLDYDSRCAAYFIQVTKAGLSIQDDYSFRFRHWAIQIAIVVLLTLIIKGLPLLLIAAPYYRRVYLPFFTLNALFIVCILSLLNFSFGRPVQAGPMESKFFNYTLLLISILECIWYYKLVGEPRSRIRLTVGVVIGSLLWVFPGFLLTVFALFLFARC